MATELLTGRASSLTAPASLAAAGRISDWSAPALTVGGSLKGRTSTVISSLAERFASVAVRRGVYSPASLKVAEVAASCGWAKVTAPGPATLDHETLRPETRPAS